jgi:cation transport ATPase
LLRSASRSTFGIKPLRSIPLEKLRLIEIPVAGLDCKACSLGAYEAIYRLDGVERATASFREGRVMALIDPEKMDRARLEAALKKRGVEVKSP